MSKLQTPKKTQKAIKDILNDSKNIKVDVVAKEVIEWLADNVENYIDNAITFFKIDMVINSTEGMTETKKLQDLYRNIPDDADVKGSEIDDLVACRHSLDKITEDVYEEMNRSKKSLKNLFNRLAFYYQKLIPNPDSKIRAMEIDEELKILINKKDELKTDKEKDKIQKQIVELIKEGEGLIQYEKLDGSVAVVKFEYDPFSIDVKLSERKNQQTKKDIEKLTDEQKNILNEYTIDEGFTCWIELNFKSDSRPTTMF